MEKRIESYPARIVIENRGIFKINWPNNNIVYIIARMQLMAYHKLYFEFSRHLEILSRTLVYDFAVSKKNVDI